VADKLKRAATLALYWKDGKLVCENYRIRSRAAISARAVEILDYHHTWRTFEQSVANFRNCSPFLLLCAVRQLTSLSLLVREGTEQAQKDDSCEKAWSDWLPEAGLLHFGCNDAPFSESEGEQRRLFQAYLQETPQPAFSKSHPGLAVLPLPPPSRQEVNFREVLFARRTHREFSAELLTLGHLSTLLHDTWGVTGTIHSGLFGELPLKTSPSGGARHPEEVYVCALRVEGLTPGIYHYVSDAHLLERIQDGLTPARVVEYCAGQSWAGSAAALFVMTAVFARTMWKYRFSRAYRVVLAEAGHLCQTFCLVACSLGLGPFSTMALKDSLIEADLGIDGVTESVLYVAGVGAPFAATTAPAQLSNLAAKDK
jgi:SagB-type dehydrogenase family enzyme